VRLHGDRAAVVAVGEVAEADGTTVAAVVEHHHARFPKRVRGGGVLLSGLAVLAEPGGEVQEAARFLAGGDGEVSHGHGVVLELDDDERLVERQVVPLGDGGGDLAAGDGARLLDVPGANPGAAGDLGVAESEHRELLVGGGLLGRGQRIPVAVLDEHVGDGVGVALDVVAHDARHGGGSGVDGGLAPPVAGDQEVAVAVGDDDKRDAHAALLDRSGQGSEVAELATDVVRVDGDRAGVEVDQRGLAGHGGSFRLHVWRGCWGLSPRPEGGSGRRPGRRGRRGRR
jgi:hypothetical protein